MLFLLIPAYALADRYAGGGAPALDARLPGRAMAWGAAACAVLGYFVGGLPAVCLALAWAFYRSLPMRALGGSATPTTSKQIVGTFGRNALPGLAAIIVALAFGLSPLLAGLWGAAYALAATATAVWYGKENAKAKEAGEPIGDQNVVVELVRGAAYGVLVAGFLGLS